MFFWNSLAFTMILWILAIWSLIPPPFLNQASTCGSSGSHMLKPSLKDNLTSMWNERNRMVVWTFFGITFSGIGMKTDLFHSTSIAPILILAHKILHLGFWNNLLDGMSVLFSLSKVYIPHCNVRSPLKMKVKSHHHCLQPCNIFFM